MGEWGPSCAVRGVGAAGVSPSLGAQGWSPSSVPAPLEGADTLFSLRAVLANLREGLAEEVRDL